MKSFVVATLTLFMTHSALAQERDARRLAEQFELAVTKWVQVEGTPTEADAYQSMVAARDALKAQGPRAIDEVVILLEHKQENIRRGSAIVLLSIVEEHRLDSQILLDKMLLRMVEDSDLKTRHNLYHVSRKLIANIRQSDRGNEQSVSGDPDAVRR